MTTSEGSATPVQSSAVKDQADAILRRLRERLAIPDKWIRTTATERPLLLLAGALGVGYLAARLLRKS